MTQTGSSCSLCHSPEVELFFRLPQVPVCTNVLEDTSEQSQSCAKGDIELVVCRSCGMIANRAFDPALVAYNHRYENSLHFSPRFQEYAEKLAWRLIRDYSLQRKTVVEIGCGKGEFLSLLCQLGDDLGVGFDPSYVEGRVDATVGQGLSIIPDHFSEKYSDLACDLLCCRHTLEHVPDPRAFLDGIRRALGDRQVPIYFEVPNALFTLRHGGIWDVIYEHRSYFCPPSMAYLFRQFGFNVRILYEDFAGQFLCLDATNADSVVEDGPIAQADEARESVTQIVQDAQKLGRQFQDRVEYWKGTLRNLFGSGKRVVVWGGGAKGVTFLNAVREPGIEYIVDLNRHKQGRFIPGTGQQVIAPEILREYRPDVVLVMNPIYYNEIQLQIRSLGLSTEVLCEGNDEYDICRLQLSRRCETSTTL